MNQVHNRGSVDNKIRSSAGVQTRGATRPRPKKCNICQKLIAPQKYVP